MGGRKNSSKSDDASAAAITPEQAKLDEIRSTPLEIVIRSLRRRLWQAFEKEDGDTALKLYRASRSDWEQWVYSEFTQQQQQTLREQQERGEARSRRKSSFLRKLRSKKDLPASAIDSNGDPQGGISTEAAVPESAAANAKSANHDDSAEDAAIEGLLQQFMHPSDPFSPDDYVDPSDPYPVDDGNPEESAASLSSKKSSSSRHRRISLVKPRQAFSFFGRSSPSAAMRQSNSTFAAAVPNNSGPASAASSDNDLDNLLSAATLMATSALQQDATEASAAISTTPAQQQHDKRMTTPLHEAARLGNGELVRAMLLRRTEADPNARNGAGRTALHMVAGGVTLEELGRIEYAKSNPSVGIRVPEPIVPETADDGHEETSKRKHAKKAVRAVGRFFREGLKKNHKSSSGAGGQTDDGGNTSSDDDAAPQTIDEMFLPNITDERWQQIVIERTDAALAILSWTYPDDGSDRVGEGPSFNSVDSECRTALHYAAELGRSDICMSVLSSFGAILTIVDDRARTPCELAAEGEHHELAAQLEARAVLHVDPYGMDDELLASVLADNTGFSNGRLVPPFSWFSTWNMAQVQEERKNRGDQALEKMLKIVESSRNEQQKKLKRLRNGGGNAPSSPRRSRSGRYMTSGSPRVKRNLKKPPSADDVVDDLNDRKMPSVQSQDLDKDQESNATTDSKPAAKCNDGAEESANATANGTAPDNSEGKEMPSVNGDKKRSPKSETSKNTSGSDGKPSADCETSTSLPTPIGGANAESAPADNNKENGDAAAATGASKEAPDSDGEGEENGALEKDIQVFSGLTSSYVEKYLAYHEWEVKKALLAFLEDPHGSFRQASVAIPVVKSASAAAKAAETEYTCDICCDDFEEGSPEWKCLSGCSHSFCKECLGDYISDCASNRTSGLAVVCPHHECEVPLSPLEIAELAPTGDVYEALINTANEHFIVAASDLRFCPHPGCTGVVKFNLPSNAKKSNVEPKLLELVGASCTACTDVSPGTDCPRTYEGVLDPNYNDARSLIPPKRAHRFCYLCGEEGIHWPVTCERLEEWKSAVQEQVKEVAGDGDSGDANYNEVAQKLWLKTNTRPCPKCQVPIEKNEGCNHMTCSNPTCKYEFCWICRNDWKLHNTETGGFFRCNRWVDQKEHDFYDAAPDENEVAAARAEEVTDPSVMSATYGTAMHEARVAGRRSREMARFLHHYQRWNAHADSAALELKMNATSCTRLAPVVQAAVEVTDRYTFNFGGKGLSFVHAAFSELLECRSMLQHSYAFSYFRYQSQHIRKYKLMKRRLSEKLAFEQLQSELEMMTEQMSDVVARTHLRATQSQIIFLTATATEKRKEFSNLMIRILEEERKEAVRDGESGEGGTESTEQSKRKSRSQKNLSHLLHTITGGRDSHAEERSPPRATVQPVVVRDEDDEEMEEAIRASLEEFMAGNSQQPGGAPSSGRPLTGDWACALCTYVNAGGSRCAMCGTQRS